MKTFHYYFESRSLRKLRNFCVSALAIGGACGIFAPDLQAADSTFLRFAEFTYQEFYNEERDYTYGEYVDSYVYFPVSENPVVSFEGNTVIVETNTESYSADISIHNGFSFVSELSSGVESVIEKNSGMELNGNTVVVTGVEKGGSVKIYSISGLTVGEYAEHDGIVTIDLSQIPGGVYILSTKNANYKIKK